MLIFTFYYMKTRTERTKFVLPVVILLLCCCSVQDRSGENYTRERRLMVQIQIESRGDFDPKIIEAILNVPRHLFVPAEYQSLAYEDHPLPIGEGQTISQPYIVALMTDILDLDSSTNVLEIGTGSGYQAAILSEICDTVYTIEINKTLGERAEKLLSELKFNNVMVKIGDGYKGWPQYAPFDAILVTCSPSHIPQALQDQLAEGGKMIIPVGGDYIQELVLLTKTEGKIDESDIISVTFVPMIDIEGKKY